MKLSIVILCWNDLAVIGDCLKSIVEGTRSLDYEVIVSDNGSTDGSIEFIRQNYPQVRLIENGINLRFAKGNNVGFKESKGEYILILNPDTIIHDGALDEIVAFADKHPEAGAVGCKVLDPDGSYQGCNRPLPTMRTEWMLALHLGGLSFLSEFFNPGEYVGWKGTEERTVGWMAGCFILMKADLLKKLGGFDEQFFYYYEDTDLCRRVWDAGYTVLYTPTVAITHLRGHSTKKRFPLGFELDKYVTRYRYYYKFGGRRAIRHCRWVTLVRLGTRLAAGTIMQLVKPNDARKLRLDLHRYSFEWNWRVNPIRLVENGEEPMLSIQVLDRVLER